MRHTKPKTRAILVAFFSILLLSVTPSLSDAKNASNKPLKTLQVKQSITTIQTQLHHILSILIPLKVHQVDYQIAPALALIQYEKDQLFSPPITQHKATFTLTGKRIKQ